MNGAVKFRSVVGSCGFSSLAPEIVETILSFLPARSLVNASLVCRLWKDVGNRVLKRRKGWTGRLFQWNKNDHKYSQHWKEETNKFLDNIDTVPSAVLVSTNRLFETKKDSTALLEYFRANLPTHCPVLSCDACGVIGENNTGYTEELADKNQAMSVLVVPKVEGVTVNVFSFSKQDIITNKCNKQLWKNSFGSLAKEDVKFVFLISESHLHKIIGKLVVGIKKVFGDHAVVIGGLSETCGVLNGNLETNTVIGLAIGGNVKTNCVVHHSHTVDTLPNSFKKLHRNQPAQRSVCFMVSCIGRGENYYGKRNVESSEFRKVFPHTRLFGLFGDGEIGSNVPTEEKQNTYKNFLHSYSTIFSILTILDEEEC